MPGGTDAILLSYYLGKVAGWSFCRKPPANISIKPDAFEQSINWYARGDDRLLICGVGGKDNMAVFFKNKILRPIVDADTFSRMAVVLDRDKDETGAIEDRASSTFRPVITAMKNESGVKEGLCLVNPMFAATDLTATFYRKFSSLDSKGRCGPATAVIDRDHMPEGERGSIGMIKPSAGRKGNDNQSDHELHGMNNQKEIAS